MNNNKKSICSSYSILILLLDSTTTRAFDLGSLPTFHLGSLTYLGPKHRANAVEGYLIFFFKNK